MGKKRREKRKAARARFVDEECVSVVSGSIVCFLFFFVRVVSRIIKYIVHTIHAYKRANEQTSKRAANMVDNQTIEKTKQRLVKVVKERSNVVSRGTDLIARAMEVAENTPELKDGKNRSRVVSAILKSPEVMSIMPESVASEIKLLMDSGILEPIMTLVSEAAKKHLDINSTTDLLKKMKSAFTECFEGCCGCCCGEEGDKDSKDSKDSKDGKGGKGGKGGASTAADDKKK